MRCRHSSVYGVADHTVRALEGVCARVSLGHARGVAHRMKEGSLKITGEDKAGINLTCYTRNGILKLFAICKSDDQRDGVRRIAERYSATQPGEGDVSAQKNRSREGYRIIMWLHHDRRYSLTQINRTVGARNSGWAEYNIQSRCKKLTANELSSLQRAEKDELALIEAAQQVAEPTSSRSRKEAVVQQMFEPELVADISANDAAETPAAAVDGLNCQTATKDTGEPSKQEIADCEEFLTIWALLREQYESDHEVAALFGISANNRYHYEKRKRVPKMRLDQARQILEKHAAKPGAEAGADATPEAASGDTVDAAATVAVEEAESSSVPAEDRVLVIREPQSHAASAASANGSAPATPAVTREILIRDTAPEPHTGLAADHPLWKDPMVGPSLLLRVTNFDIEQLLAKHEAMIETGIGAIYKNAFARRIEHLKAALTVD